MSKIAASLSITSLLPDGVADTKWFRTERADLSGKFIAKVDRTCRVRRGECGPQGSQIRMRGGVDAGSGGILARPPIAVEDDQ